MLSNFARVLLTSALLVVSASASLAQAAAPWKVGDKVEVRNMSDEWVPATVLAVQDERRDGAGFTYRIHVDDPNAGIPVFYRMLSDRVRAPYVQPQADEKPNNEAAPGGNPPLPTPGAWEVGDAIDVYYEASLYGPNKGKDRGKIMEVGAGKYKVHYTGCAARWDEWVDRTLIRPAAITAPGAPEIKFLIGKWSMTTVGISSVAVAWGKSNDILINGDGTYTWYQPHNAPAIKGKWIADPKIEGAKDGPAKADGLLIKDAMGHEWKVYRRISTADNADQVQTYQMCQGLSDIGTRAR